MIEVRAPRGSLEGRRPAARAGDAQVEQFVQQQGAR